MTEDVSNQAIAACLFLSEGAISKHATAIFTKLGTAPDVNNNRRSFHTSKQMNERSGRQ